MKEIDHLATTVVKTICPFCSYGCEFGVAFNDFGVKGIEYIKDGSSGGRLCPRGSAAALYLDHRRRLSSPLRHGKKIEWQKITKELTRVVEKPKNIAVSFDRNITFEEYLAIIGFCKEVGIENIASAYFEPETYLKEFLKTPFSIDEVERADVVIVLGDPFNQAPMTSHALINWKLSDRKHRLVVIDSINTHTAVFATDFLKVNVGTEPLVLLALAQENIKGIDVSQTTGISDDVIKDIAKNFKEARDGLVIACLAYGHTYDPLLVAESLARLHTLSGKKVVPFVEFSGFEGNQHFGSIINSVKKKKIKHLINFGELFPYYYPQVLKDLKALNIYATSPLKYNGGTTLPAALNLEKAGTVITTFGKKSLSGNITPASGARTISDILALFAKDYREGEQLVAPKMKIDVGERVANLVAKSMAKKKKTYTLIGEKIAYNFLAFFEDEMIKVNPLDAGELGLQPHDTVSVKSKNGEVDLSIRISDDVPQGVVAVPVETPHVKGLFDLEVDAVNNVVNFIPTEVTIWRRG